MTVYLLHYFYPISNRHTAQHYLGFAYNIDRRIQQQRRGKKGIAANFCHVAKTRKIPFVVAREWKDGGRKLERRLKNRKTIGNFVPYAMDRFRRCHSMLIFISLLPRSVFLCRQFAQDNRRQTPGTSGDGVRLSFTEKPEHECYSVPVQYRRCLFGRSHLGF